MAKASKERYQEMIAALSTFQMEVSDAAETMINAAVVCTNNMEKDDVSQRACGKVQNSAQKYSDAIDKAKKLQVALQEELDEIIEYEREAAEDD